MGEPKLLEPDAQKAAQKRRVLVTVGTLLVAMLLADMALIALLDWIERSPARLLFGMRWVDLKALYAGVIFGAFAAQVLLVTAWSAFGDGSSPKRVLFTTFTLAVFTNVLVLFTMWWLEAYWINAVAIFLIPLLMFFLLQIPLWAVRSFLGWTIASPWAERRERRTMRFTLAHLLCWSAFLAVPLCILQALLQGGPIGWLRQAIVMCVLGLILCGQLLWLLYIGLGPRRRWWQTALALSAMLLAVSGAFMGLMLIVEGRPRHPAVPMLLTGHGSVSAVLLVCFRIARGFGFRLLPFEGPQEAKL